MYPMLRFCQLLFQETFSFCKILSYWIISNTNFPSIANIVFVAFAKRLEFKECLEVYVAMPQVIKLFFLDLGGSI